MVGHEMDEAKVDFLIANRADIGRGFFSLHPVVQLYNISGIK